MLLLKACPGNSATECSSKSNLLLPSFSIIIQICRAGVAQSV
jgi:hypothetical protein